MSTTNAFHTIWNRAIIFFSCSVIGVSSRTRVSHLEKFSRHIHADEIIIFFIKLKLPEDFFNTYFPLSPVPNGKIVDVVSFTTPITNSQRHCIYLQRN